MRSFSPVPVVNLVSRSSRQKKMNFYPSVSWFPRFGSCGLPGTLPQSLFHRYIPRPSHNVPPVLSYCRGVPRISFPGVIDSVLFVSATSTLFSAPNPNSSTLPRSGGVKEFPPFDPVLGKNLSFFSEVFVANLAYFHVTVRLSARPQRFPQYADRSPDNLPHSSWRPPHVWFAVPPAIDTVPPASHGGRFFAVSGNFFPVLPFPIWASTTIF